MEANTALGQHFMVDKNLLQRIVHIAQLSKEDVVLEIGPGLGALTRYLEKETSSLITVDIDERFVATHHGNILKLIGALSFDTIVSNLPYHICEPLFIKLLTYLPKKIIVVVGDKFARGLEEETILGSVFREAYEVEYVETIAPESFSPPPAVTSALITCTLKNDFGLMADFYEYSKLKVKNYLKNKTPTKKGAQEFINKLRVPLQEKRLYELNVEEFLELYKVVHLM